MARFDDRITSTEHAHEYDERRAILDMIHAESGFDTLSDFDIECLSARIHDDEHIDDSMAEWAEKGLWDEAAGDS